MLGMKWITSPPTHLHRLAGIPVSYSPPTRTPFLLRLRAAGWRTLFSVWERLRPRRSTHGLDRIVQ